MTLEAPAGLAICRAGSICAGIFTLVLRRIRFAERLILDFRGEQQEREQQHVKPVIPGRTCVVLMSTNPALPRTGWTPLATNTFDVTGRFQFTNSAGSGLRQFYRLQAP